MLDGIALGTFIYWVLKTVTNEKIIGVAPYRNCVGDTFQAGVLDQSLTNSSSAFNFQN